MSKTPVTSQKISEAIMNLCETRRIVYELMKKQEEYLHELLSTINNVQNTNSNEQEYVNEKQASILTGIPVGTLQQKRSRCEEPKYYKIGRSVLYRREELLDWIRSKVRYSDNDFRRGYKPR